jgi:predicted RNase H-like HicB family nuclease
VKEGFVVKCLELPGCLTEGKTKTEALRNIHDAIRLYLADIKKEVKHRRAGPIKVSIYTDRPKFMIYHHRITIDPS